jgi:Zn-finger nucleic acid-binding protein
MSEDGVGRCPSCSGRLPDGFPGATVTCACGTTTTLDTISSAAGPGSPYRTAGSVRPDTVETSCPFCSNSCPPLVDICPYCDVRLDAVRCLRCYSLQTPGSFLCGRCGEALKLEPLLDASDAPCPRCRTPLEVVPAGASVARESARDARVPECPRCGGMFVPRDALAEILSRAELRGPLSSARPGVMPLDQVKYVPCPLCHTPMNRVNFGRVSGVIVDVCRAHGTWFDAGELTRVVNFAAVELSPAVGRSTGRCSHLRRYRPADR